MVYSHVPVTLSAILTGFMITAHNILFCELDIQIMGNTDKNEKPYYRRYKKSRTDRMNAKHRALDNFRLACPDHYYCAFGAAHRERFKIVIKEKNITFKHFSALIRMFTPKKTFAIEPFAKVFF